MHGQRSCLLPGLSVCLLFATAAGAQDLPAGKGKAEFARVCGQCHGVQVVIKTTNTPDGWAGVVDDMVSRGAQGTQDDFDLVTKYLATHFGPKVNVNKASEAELSAALGLTSADAQAIVRYRQTGGSFKDLSDLEKVPHIDTKKLEDEKNRIDYSGAQPSSPDNK